MRICRNLGFVSQEPDPNNPPPQLCMGCDTCHTALTWCPCELRTALWGHAITPISTGRRKAQK